MQREQSDNQDLGTTLSYCSSQMTHNCNTYIRLGRNQTNHFSTKGQGKAHAKTH